MSSRCLLKLLALSALVGLFAAPAFAMAAQEPIAELTCDNGRFQPTALNVTAKESVRIKVTNKGSSPIEFESFEMNRERVVPPGHSVTVILPKLDPGEYHFFDDFHHEVGPGTITAR